MRDTAWTWPGQAEQGQLNCLEVWAGGESKGWVVLDLWFKAKVWRVRQTWVQVPALSLNACVTLSTLLSHSELH